MFTTIGIDIPVFTTKENHKTENWEVFIQFMTKNTYKIGRGF